MPKQSSNDQLRDEVLSAELQQLQRGCYSQLRNDVRTHIDAAVKLLSMILRDMYGPLGTLKDLECKSHNVGENEKFAMSFFRVSVEQLRWASSTRVRALRLLKRALGALTSVDKNFLATVRQISTEKTAHINFCMPLRYGKLPRDHPTRLYIEEWIRAFRENTSCRTEATLSSVVGFLLKLARIQNWDVEKHHSTWSAPDPALVQQACRTPSYGHHIAWTRAFFRHVLGIEDFDFTGIAANLALEFKRKEIEAAPIHDDHDYRRISSADLDKLYDVCAASTNILDEIFFLLLITTGMRSCAAARIRLEHIVETTADGTYSIRDCARTIEKGRKWFAFALVPRLRQLLLRWVKELRPARGNPYLFPGTGARPICAEQIRHSFRAVCKTAGFEDHPALRPHAMRHTFAHILHEQDNSPETISKLMNHSSVETTKKYYLKEDAVDVLQRTTVPWFKDQTLKKQPLPNFLTKVVVDTTENQSHAAALQSKKRKLSDLSMFKLLNE